MLPTCDVLILCAGDMVSSKGDPISRRGQQQDQEEKKKTRKGVRHRKKERGDLWDKRLSH
jgi:hypothetical protein